MTHRFCNLNIYQSIKINAFKLKLRLAECVFHFCYHRNRFGCVTLGLVISVNLYAVTVGAIYACLYYFERNLCHRDIFVHAAVRLPGKLK